MCCCIVSCAECVGGWVNVVVYLSVLCLCVESIVCVVCVVVLCLVQNVWVGGLMLWCILSVLCVCVCACAWCV